ncbi:uncharacterized protein LOC127123536 [Lathyrus oleraceus]|uniref:uncharacterized protein LOC127123536 n=1 Tax=Pisum sativum TaxID=3888 RepID=UPI0021D35E42|nr:uncharacterized protein LOC127123536 [Pisum sativum]
MGRPYSAPTDIGKQRVEDEKKHSGGGTIAYVKCFKCGEFNHHANECKDSVLSTNCQKSKKAQSEGKVFALTGTKTAIAGRLIQDTCFINDIPLISIIDTSATHLFVALDCAERLGLKLSYMDGNMIVCLPLRNLYAILGMNWLEFIHVHINYFDKTMSLLEFDATDELFMSAKKVDEL